MNYYQIIINEINGVTEYHDLPIKSHGILSSHVRDTQSWIWKNLKERDLDFSNLEGSEVYVRRLTDGNSNTDKENQKYYLKFVVTEDNYDLYKIEIFHTNDKGKERKVQTLAFDPETNLRTIYNNNIHNEWIADDVEKELEDKIKRLERLTK